VRTVRAVALLAVAAGAAPSQTARHRPLIVEIGGIRLTPGGFLDLIGMERSATTPDPIYTRFGAIPLGDTPGETLVSPAHSRVQLRADHIEGPLQLTAYVESDFLNPVPGAAPYRWRQLWGAVRWGGWELLGGKAWSLLRPNRVGVASDAGLMNTLVIEPAYHVGIVGSRNRQFRLSRTIGDYHAVFAWETAGNFLAKATVDKPFGHLELAALAGRRDQRGLSAAAVLRASRTLHVVAQQYWSKHAAAQALGVVPNGLSGGSSLEGLELDLTRRLNIYGYAGWVWAGRSPGNHVVREYTAGGSYRIPVPSVHGVAIWGLQYSHMSRDLWTGQSGAMDYLLASFRWAIE
jgi:hypothetical protein